MPDSAFLLVDFGATHVKSMLWTPGQPASSTIRVDPAPTSVSTTPRHCEIPLKAFHELFARILREVETTQPLAGILLCSQMHGFAVLTEDGQPLTEYISWKDERSLDSVDGKSTFEWAAGELGERYRLITGMKPRAGFPFFNLLHLLRLKTLSHQRLQIVTIPDWLANVSGRSYGKSHPTMLAGLGLWDLTTQRASEELLALAGSSTDIRINDAAEAHEVAGTWKGQRGDVPIYVGLGDHACAILGADCAPETSISLNIATGSQASRIQSSAVPAGAEERPYLDGKRLHTITHIPAGRALEEFLRLPAEAAGTPENLRPYWDVIDHLTVDEIDRSTLEIDLALFQSAWNYKDGGGLQRIKEKHWTIREFGAGLVRSMARQYLPAIAILDPTSSAKELVLSGGLARKLTALPELFKRWTGRKVCPAATLDETLLGLRQIAQQIATVRA